MMCRHLPALQCWCELPPSVLTGLLGGKGNLEMAEQLCLSEVAIKHHLKDLSSKLGAKNRTHAVCRAIEISIG